jgi:hypothetical protein
MSVVIFSTRFESMLYATTAGKPRRKIPLACAYQGFRDAVMTVSIPPPRCRKRNLTERIDDTDTVPDRPMYTDGNADRAMYRRNRTRSFTSLVICRSIAFDTLYGTLAFQKETRRGDVRERRVLGSAQWLRAGKVTPKQS